MTPRERWLGTIRKEPVDRVPMDFWGTPEVCRSLVDHLGAKDMSEVCDRLHIDRPLDLQLPYIGPPLDPGIDPCGVRVKPVAYRAGSYDEVEFSPLAEYESIQEIEDRYTWPGADLYDTSGLPQQIEAAGEKQLPAQFLMSGIYALYTRLRGMEQAFIDFALNQDIVLYCMDRLVDTRCEIARRVFETIPDRIDLVWLYNDLGSQEDLLCSPDTVRKLFLSGIRKMAGLARGAGATVCLHSDGAIRRIIPDLIDCGIQVLNPIQWRCSGMDRRELKRDFGKHVTFHGAMDNQQTLVQGNEQAVRREVRENIDIFAADGGGYVLAPCHNFQPVTSPHIIVAMYDEGRNYGRR